MGQVQSMFRSQLVFDEQRSLFDYWQSKCRDTNLPSRSDISPVDIVSHLKMISLIEVCDTPQCRRYKYRLAGTGLHSWFKQEATGKMLDELHGQDSHEYWQRILDVLVTRKRAACGATSPEGAAAHGYAQFWMRLPLMAADGKINMILSYDVITPLSALSACDRAQIAYA